MEEDWEASVALVIVSGREAKPGEEEDERGQAVGKGESLQIQWTLGDPSLLPRPPKPGSQPKPQISPEPLLPTKDCIHLIISRMCQI